MEKPKKTSLIEAPDIEAVRENTHIDVGKKELRLGMILIAATSGLINTNKTNNNPTGIPSARKTDRIPL